MNCSLNNYWTPEAWCFYGLVFIAASSWLQYLVSVNVNYGKLSGFSVFRLPSHVAWMIYESPNLFVSFYFLLTHGLPSTIPQLAMLAMFIGHYIQRVCIYPLKLVGISRKCPLEIASYAFFFCILNGFYQSYSIFNLCSFENDYIYNWNFSVGILIFLLGMFINIRSDNILLQTKRSLIEQLKKDNPNFDIETTPKIYGIPRGFIFEYVSAANYFGETVEWIGYAISSWSFNGTVFAFTTFNCLLARAMTSHRWYKKTFNDYPKNRKAMVPFLI